jgi:ABC-type branched-subunit amino acid transport system substrate-binding protein
VGWILSVQQKAIQWRRKIMVRKSFRLGGLVMAGALAISACGGSSDSTSTEAPTSEAPTSEAPSTDAPTTDAPATTWAVNTDDCVDPEAANAPITGTVKIGNVLPLSGSVAAIAFAPVKAGFESYIKMANEQKMLGDTTIEVSFEDDQYNKDLTPGAVNKLLDAGVNLFSGIIGTPNNAAVRDTLNEECVPQLQALTGSPAWGDVANFPWTTGALAPYGIEAKVYASQIKEQFPDGAKVALFTVNNEFGQVYLEAFKEVAEAADSGIEIVDEQTIEADSSTPPTAQINAIASKAPDAIVAVPLGAQCPTFLTEVANAKAANTGWAPSIFLTNTCASALILAGAGDAADGLYTSNNLVDVNDPAIAAKPAVAEYIEFMTAQGNKDIVTTASAGWHVAEVTVAILKQASESPEGLTRASIMNAARNYSLVPSLAREGVVLTMNGEADAFQAESLQVVQYEFATGTFKDVGSLISEFES